MAPERANKQPRTRGKRADQSRVWRSPGVGGLESGSLSEGAELGHASISGVCNNRLWTAPAVSPAG